MDENELFEMNRVAWNTRTALHLAADWYGHDAFRAGATSLKEIERALLGEVDGQSILHLQCHFGQDTISLARMGARVVGVDLSDAAIDAARSLAKECDADARFVHCNVYDTRTHIQETFDRVFVSYGTIAWLPRVEPWAEVVAASLKPGGELVFVEFHPVLWTFDDDVAKVGYDYDSPEPIVEESTGTYGAPGVTTQLREAGFNHGLGTVVSALLGAGLELSSLREYDYSPYDCFAHAVEEEPGRYRVGTHAARIPLVYSITARKPA